MRLIDADKLKRHYAWWGSENANGELKERKTDFDIIVDLQPTIEAEPIRHGKWTISEYEYYDCSACGESYYSGMDSTRQAKEFLKNNGAYKFCPWCGAKMDKEEEK